MSLDRLESVLVEKLDDLREKGTLKGDEKVVTGVISEDGKKGPRFLIDGYGEMEFLRMNSNSYLGMSLQKEMMGAEEECTKTFGTGPGSVRFISGTYRPHIELEKGLAEFHNREAAMVFSSAYATVMGVITPLIDNESMVFSDELNHNSIINAIRLSRPKAKDIYKHLDMADLEDKLKNAIGKGKRVLVITDGIFSMRGDYAPLDTISEICARYNSEFGEGIILAVDDSHGVGAFGKTGRGTEEHTNAKEVDILIGTLGKAIGVNGGYIASTSTIINYLRQTSPFYVYSNPITPSEAASASKALEILNGPKGKEMLNNLRRLTKRFEDGLKTLGYEVIESEHPVVPLMVRDTARTSELVQHLTEHGILATGLSFPVVPKGDEEIRFQVSAEHTEYDIDYVVDILRQFKK